MAVATIFLVFLWALSPRVISANGLLTKPTFLSSANLIPGKGKAIDHWEASNGKAAQVSAMEKAKKQFVETSNSITGMVIAQKVASDGRRVGIVHKSNAFWSSFKDFDIPRRVFQGQFHGLENNNQFRAYYLSYVDSYDKVCKRYLPRGNQTVQLTTTLWKEKDSAPGVRENQRKFVVSMDRRFLNKYKLYSENNEANQKRQGLASILGVFTSKTPRFESIVENVAEDFKKSRNRDLQMQRFFERVSCNSASAKQMGENFLRAANGNVSLQDSGRQMVGAEKETDPMTKEDINQAAYESLAYAREAKRLEAINNAKSANATGKGWPFYEKKIQRFGNNVGIEDYDSARIINNARLQSALFTMKRSGQEVLYCRYGPKGTWENGAPRLEMWRYWYKKVPDQLTEVLALDKKGAMAEDLRLGVAAKKCPANTVKAKALYGGAL